MTWCSIIQQAASTRFARTGSCDAFKLIRRDLQALCEEICGAPLQLEAADWVQVQARVPVPELKMQIVVDEWTKETP